MSMKTFFMVHRAAEEAEGTTASCFLSNNSNWQLTGVSRGKKGPASDRSQVKVICTVGA